MASVLGSVMYRCADVRTWRRTTRSELAAQINAAGSGGVGITVFVGVTVGASVVVPLQLWFSNIGLTEFLNSFLVTFVFREASPLLVNLIIVARCGSFVAADLGTMWSRGEDRVLAAQGVSALEYLIIPRVAAVCVASLGLAVVLGISCALSSYILGRLVYASTIASPSFFGVLLHEMSALDGLYVVIITAVPALFTGVICCVVGMECGNRQLDVPTATRKAIVRSLGAMFFIVLIASLVRHL